MRRWLIGVAALATVSAFPAADTGDSPELAAAKAAMRAAGHSEEAIREAERRADEVLERVSRIDVDAVVRGIPADIALRGWEGAERAQQAIRRATRREHAVKRQLVESGHPQEEVEAALRQTEELVADIRRRLAQGESARSILQSRGIDASSLALDLAPSTANVHSPVDGEMGETDPLCALTRVEAASARAQCESDTEAAYQECVVLPAWSCSGAREEVRAINPGIELMDPAECEGVLTIYDGCVNARESSLRNCRMIEAAAACALDR